MSFMKKKKFGYKLSRGKGARKALFRGLVKALVMHDGIETTYAKARAVRPEIEKLIKIAKNGDIISRRRVYARLANDRATTDLLFDLAEMFKDRKGGFTKIVDLGVRKGDNARLVKLTWSVTKKAEPKKAKGGSEASSKSRSKTKAVGKVKKALTKKGSKEK